MYGTFSWVCTWWGVWVGATSAVAIIPDDSPWLVAPWFAFCNQSGLPGCHVSGLACSHSRHSSRLLSHAACRSFCPQTSPGFRKLALVFQYTSCHPSVLGSGWPHGFRRFLPGFADHLSSGLFCTLEWIGKGVSLCVPSLFILGSAVRVRAGHLVLDTNQLILGMYRCIGIGFGIGSIGAFLGYWYRYR